MAMVERTECDDAAASQEEKGTPSMSALIASALANAKAYFSIGASASTDLSVSVETVAAPAAAGPSQCKSPTPVCTRRMGTKRKHAGDASVVVITHAQISSGEKKDHPSLAELQKLNESTVLLNQQGYSKLPVSVRKPDALTHQDTRRSTKAEYLNHVVANGCRQHYGAIEC
jgi:hypothetical protein